MRGTIEFFLIDLRNESYYFFSINKIRKTASRPILLILYNAEKKSFYVFLTTVFSKY